LACCALSCCDTCGRDVTLGAVQTEQASALQGAPVLPHPRSERWEAAGRAVASDPSARTPARPAAVAPGSSVPRAGKSLGSAQVAAVAQRAAEPATKDVTTDSARNFPEATQPENTGLVPCAVPGHAPTPPRPAKPVRGSSHPAATRHQRVEAARASASRHHARIRELAAVATGGTAASTVAMKARSISPLPPPARTPPRRVAELRAGLGTHCSLSTPGGGAARTPASTPPGTPVTTPHRRPALASSAMRAPLHALPPASPQTLWSPAAPSVAQRAGGTLGPSRSAGVAAPPPRAAQASRLHASVPCRAHCSARPAALLSPQDALEQQLRSPGAARAGSPLGEGSAGRAREASASPHRCQGIVAGSQISLQVRFRLFLLLAVAFSMVTVASVTVASQWPIQWQHPVLQQPCLLPTIFRALSSPARVACLPAATE
jgi:hypothetical protein